MSQWYRRLHLRLVWHQRHQTRDYLWRRFSPACFTHGYKFLVMCWKRKFLGVPYFEADFCARLLGEKIFFTEFMAFQSLATAKEYREMGREKCDCDGNQKWLSELSETIMTYALCGFANIPVTCLFYKIKNIQRGKQTMGIMLGTMAGLAPKRKKVFSKILAKTCVAGTICCLIRGCIACIFVRISLLNGLIGVSVPTVW